MYNGRLRAVCQLLTYVQPPYVGWVCSTTFNMITVYRKGFFTSCLNSCMIRYSHLLLLRPPELALIRVRLNEPWSDADPGLIVDVMVCWLERRRQAFFTALVSLISVLIALATATVAAISYNAEIQAAEHLNDIQQNCHLLFKNWPADITCSMRLTHSKENWTL